VSWGKPKGGTSKIYGTVSSVPTFLSETLALYYVDLQYRLQFGEQQKAIS